MEIFKRMMQNSHSDDFPHLVLDANFLKYLHSALFYYLHRLCRQVDFDQLQENLCQMERRCKASWDHLKVIAKHEMKPQLKQKMSDFLKDCAERIIILKIVHRRIINRYCSSPQHNFIQIVCLSV